MVALFRSQQGSSFRWQLRVAREKPGQAYTKHQRTQTLRCFERTGPEFSTWCVISSHITLHARGLFRLTPPPPPPVAHGPWEKGVVCSSGCLLVRSPPWCRSRNSWGYHTVEDFFLSRKDKDELLRGHMVNAYTRDSHWERSVTSSLWPGLEKQGWWGNRVLLTY